jgi:outer membrane protein assembly factor BamB
MRLCLALALCLLLSACSSDDSGPPTTVPSLPWGLFRHDSNNTGSGNSITENRGEVTLVASSLGGVGLSSPTVDRDSNVYLGTRSGVISVDREGKTRWQLATCAPEGGVALPIGSISSTLNVQAGGAIVFGSDASTGERGAIFYVKEENKDVTCQWAFETTSELARSGIRSSAQVQIDPSDLSLLSAFIGSDNGYLQAINGIGTPRWTFPNGAGGGPITSTPAVGINSATYVTTPEGLLLGVDSAGRRLQGNGWPFPIGVPPAAPLQQSASVDVSVYAIGAGSALYAINPDGSLKWQYLPQADVLGSQAFISQSVDEGSMTLFDTIVYIVDRNGTLYGIRDSTGQPMVTQRCSDDVERSCRFDSCEIAGSECKNNKCDIGECSDDPTTTCMNDDDCPEGTGTCDRMDCTPDSCKSDNKGMCELTYPGVLPLTTEAITVETSPVVSGDLFAIVGTADGRVCARALDTTVPGDMDNPDNPWILGNGCIELGDGLPVLSSPAIGPHSRIYVTTATGLYVIE